MFTKWSRSFEDRVCVHVLGLFTNGPKYTRLFTNKLLFIQVIWGQGADVWVIYKWTKVTRLFTNGPKYTRLFTDK